MNPELTEQALSLSGLPTSIRDTDEDAKRFDLLILRRQLAQLDGDTLLAERLRALVRFIDKTHRDPIYTDFEDTLSEAVSIALPGIAPGTDLERFRAKAAAYLAKHADHVALQRLRRNKQLTPEDLIALEDMLITSGGAARSDIAQLSARMGGLGLFVRSLVGLERSAVEEAFADFLDGTKFTVEQVRFMTLVVDELTANGVMEPERLFESPFTDHAPTGPDFYYGHGEIDLIVDILHVVKAHAVAGEVA